MDIFSKLNLLCAPARYDVSSPNQLDNLEIKSGKNFATRLLLPNGGYINVLKILFSNKCIHDCRYCFNTCKKFHRRIHFKSHELARLFINLKNRKYVSGLFLSSAVTRNAEETMEQMVETVELLRSPQYNFNGYIHLKVLPGAPYDLIKRGALVSDRMSVNLEAPNKSRFSELTSTKNYYTDILKRVEWLKGLKAEDGYIKSGHTTQFVVGASDESDREILRMTYKLYKKFDLNRTYYSAFEPIKDTVLQNHLPTPEIRQHRLYQSDWLLRIYGFKFSEIEKAFDENNNLPLNRDPKTIIAKFNRDLYPLEINEATHEDLIRVPGIGPKTAKKIMVFRKLYGKIKKLSQLKELGVILKRALPYVKVQGKFQKILNDFYNSISELNRFSKIF
ncbi:MAG: helix-hairpin-helix domain-containing protein [Candidatus Helarchaeota archaeon]